MLFTNYGCVHPLKDQSQLSIIGEYLHSLQHKNPTIVKQMQKFKQQWIHNENFDLVYQGQCKKQQNIGLASVNDVAPANLKFIFSAFKGIAAFRYKNNESVGTYDHSKLDAGVIVNCLTGQSIKSNQFEFYKTYKVCEKIKMQLGSVQRQCKNYFKIQFTSLDIEVQSDMLEKYEKQIIRHNLLSGGIAFYKFVSHGKNYPRICTIRANNGENNSSSIILFKEYEVLEKDYFDIVVTDQNNTSYIGSFVKDHFDGQYIYINGASRSGHFPNWKQQQQGKLKSQFGAVLSGIFVNNCLESQNSTTTIDLKRAIATALNVSSIDYDGQVSIK